MKTLMALFLTLLPVSAVTKEFVRIYQPLSMHETDSSNESGPSGELLQAEVLARPMVLSGAFPEDLVKAVAMPCKLPTNNPDYDVDEVNLVVLCGVSFAIARDEDQVGVTIDLTSYKQPEEIDLKLETLCEMIVESIRRTLRTYYRHSEEGGFTVEILFRGPDETTKQVKALEGKFEVPAGQ